MSLDLDKRQLAMLREMGIRLWQPLPEPVVADSVPSVVAAQPLPAAVPVAVPVAAPAPAPAAPPAMRAPVQPTSAPSAAPTVAASTPQVAGTAWRMGDALALYAASANVGANAGRWLLLVETHAEAPSDPFAGEVGQLLDNMLRATGLHQGAEVWLVPVLRQPGAVGVQAPLLAALTTLIEQRQPDVLLIMGRLAAQALLQSTEPLGKLRGQVHTLQGAPAVVTYDAAALLRNPIDKAKAWDDLCLALHTAQAPRQAR